MKLSQEAINELKKSNLYELFINKMILNNGETEDTTYIGKYRGFFLFESETDEESFALNSKYYEKEGFNISSYDGINEVKKYIDDVFEYDGFKEIQEQ